MRKGEYYQDKPRRNWVVRVNDGEQMEMVKRQGKTILVLLRNIRKYSTAEKLYHNSYKYL